MPAAELAGDDRRVDGPDLGHRGGVVRSDRFRVMASDTLVVVVDGPEDALARARQRLSALERRWSRFLPGSEVTRLNSCAGQELPVHPDTALLVATAVDAHRATGGLFDPTLLPAVAAAGYRRSLDGRAPVPVPPTAGVRAGAAAEIAFDLRRGHVRLPADVAFDPGGIGKGLAADLVATELLAAGASGVLVDVGGDIRVIGLAPAAAGWLVGIEAARRPGHDALVLTLADGGVATSGPHHRRLVDDDGRVGHHLLDPATGRPAAGVPDSATVVAGTAAVAEAFATALAVGGTAGEEAVRSAGLTGLLQDPLRAIGPIERFLR